MANTAEPDSLLHWVGKIAFRDRERAAKNLERVVERVSAGIMDSVPPLLLESADPDSALNGFERLTAVAGPDTMRVLDRNRVLIHYALVVFAHSHFLGETLTQNLDLFQLFLRERNLDRVHSREEFHEALARLRARWFEADTALLLARFKRREYVRIMLRDVLGIATLAETTAEISALADVLIEEALRVCEAALRERYGTPQHRDAAGRLVDAPFAVLSLGKLGGNELNYSSDIDLLFLYGDGEDAGTASISNREYFIRLGQEITQLLSRVTAEGAAFRIDLRLRPQGGEGEPAVGLGHALHYYARTAHDWELQAMIKLRHSAGDLALSRSFIRGIQKYIYGAKLNFEAIETALDARDRMLQRRRRITARGAAPTLDVKLDRGGIRDIEFLVQCLQRVYGGPETWLRSGSTMFSLQKLHDKQHITGKEFHDLTTAYEFLRKLEHRLQLRTGQQIHRLPEDEAELRFLYRSLGADETGQYDPKGMVGLVRTRMQAVAEIYERIIHHQQRQHQREDVAAEFQLGSILFAPGREATESQVLERLAADSPELYAMVQRERLSLAARRDLTRFLSAAFTSSERYATVARHPRAVARALSLFGASDYLTDILVRYPEETATLEKVGMPQPAAANTLLEAPEAPFAAPIADPIVEYLGSAEISYGQKLAYLRQYCRHRMFLSGARDLMALRPVYAALGETSEVGRTAVAAALAIAGQPPDFAVLALGRLGTDEYDLLSDADLLFVRDEPVGMRAASRIAEQVVEVLSTYTREGFVCQVDTRLRPHGAEGELVVTPAGLESYALGEAQAWEALTYTKTRFLAGSVEVGERALAATARLATRFAADPGFLEAVRAMRAKLEKSDPSPRNLKTSAGALYDLDFIAGQSLVRQGTGALPQNLRRRLRAMLQSGILNHEDWAVLDGAGEFLRTLDHLVRLVTGRPRRTLPTAGRARDVIEQLAAGILQRQFPRGLEIELDETLLRVREIYDRVLV